MIVTMLTFVGAWAQYGITYNGTSATITETSPGINLEAIVSDINTNHSDVVNFSLPSSWTKEQVNTFAQGVTNKKSISKDTYGTVDVWSYIDPKTSASTSYTGTVYAGSAIGKPGDNYGKLNSYQVVPTAENISYVKSGTSDVYTVSSTTPILYQGGNEYGVEEGNLIDLYVAYMNGSERYTGALMALEGGNAYGNTGNAVEVTTANVPYTYNTGGFDYVYLGSDVYTNADKKYYLPNTDEIKALTVVEQWHTYSPTGAVVSKDDYTISGPYYADWDVNHTQPYYNGVDSWGGTTPLYVTSSYAYDEGTAYTGTIYTLDEVKYGYIGSDAHELTAVNASLTYETSTNKVYTGRLYKDASDNTVGADGADIALTTKRFSDVACTVEYTGPATEDNSKGGTDPFLLSKSYTYTYTDLTGTEHTSDPFASKQTQINLSGDELYIELANNPYDAKTASELIVYAENAGDLKAFMDAMSNEDKTAVTTLRIVGTVNGDDVKFASMTKLNLLDISECEGVDFNDVTVASVLNVIDADDMSLDALKEKYKTLYDKVANAFSFQEKSDDSDPLEMNTYMTNPSVGNLAVVAEGVNTIAMINGDYFSYPTQYFQAINQIPTLQTVVLAKSLVSQQDMSALTNPNIKRVILQDGQAANIDKFVVGSNRTDVVLQTYATDTKIITIKTKAGNLAAITNAHYYTPELNDSKSIVIKGTLNDDDVDFLDKVHTSGLDLSAVTHTNQSEADALKSELANLNNDFIKYLALPDFGANAEDSYFETILGNCDNLLSVGQYAATDKAFKAFSKEAGSIGELTEMLADLTGNNAGIKDIKIAGKVNATDLAGSNSLLVDENGHLVLKRGYDLGMRSYTAETTAADGRYPFTGAFTGATPTKIDYSLVELSYNPDNAAEKLAAQNDMHLAALGCYSYASEIALPRSATYYRIMDGAFIGVGLLDTKKISSLCIPQNVTEIGASAFKNSNTIELIYTQNADDTYIINGIKYPGDISETDLAAALVAGNFSCTLPSHLARVEEGAFSNVKCFRDVYVTNPNTDPVPYCEAFSFDSQSLYGWGGYKGGHPITAESYGIDYSATTMDHAKGTFSILHFPNDATEEQIKLYQDITREYSVVDEAGNTDGNGQPLRWPTQVEWNRSYQQANSGYLWNDWAEHLDEIINTKNMETRYGYTEHNQTYKGLDSYSDDNYYGADLEKNNTFAPVNAGFVKGETSYFEKLNTWIGWHQFVLSSTYHPDAKPGEVQRDFSKFKKNQWYTICLDFNMTKSQLIDVFGARYDAEKEKYVDGVKITSDKLPQVATLKGVTRNYDNDRITLYISHDLMDQSFEFNGDHEFVKRGYTEAEMVDTDGDGTPEDPIVIKRGWPYLIRPYFPTDTPSGTRPSEYVCSLLPVGDINYNDVRTNLKRDYYVKAKKTVNKVTTWEEAESGTVGGQDIPQPEYELANGNKEEGNMEYRYYFIGSFFKHVLPVHTYYISGGQFYYYNQAVAGWYWNPNVCIIGAKATPTLTVTDTENDASNVSMNFLPQDDWFIKVDQQGAKKIAPVFGISFEDDEAVTGIDEIEIDGNKYAVEHNVNYAVYNANGQYVGNSLSNLAKGIYIVNGKKFVVK